VVLNVASLGVLAAMLCLSRRHRGEARAPAGETTPEICLHGDQIYNNPQDPALFVEKRVGLGLTFNFGKPFAWIVLALMLLVLAGMVFLAIRFTGA
jgi:hypothetical protein